MTKEYGVALDNGHIEMFTKLKAAKAYAKQNGIQFIDVYDAETLELLTDIKLTN